MARPLSAALLAAQAIRSPKISVSATVSNRGLNPNIGSIAWTSLDDPGSTASTAPHGGAFYPDTGSMIEFQAAALDLRFRFVTNPHLAASWSSRSWTTIASITADALHCLARNNTTIRCYYIYAPDIYYVDIYYNSGSPYAGSPTLYRSGYNCAYDIIYCRSSSSSHSIFPWDCVAFTNYLSGTFSAYIGTAKYADNWRAAGVLFDEDDLDNAYFLVAREPDNGATRFRVVKWDGSTFTDPVDIDETQAGLFGLTLNALKIFQPSVRSTDYYGVSLESSYMGDHFPGLCSVWQQGSNWTMDEALIVDPAIPYYNDRIYSALAYDDTDNSWYFFGRYFCSHGQPQTATSDTLYPSSYVYDDHYLELTLPAGTPTLYVGQLLTLRRTISWNTDTGYEELIFYITEVSRGKRHTTLSAVDPVGFLGISRCRRPHVISSTDIDGLTGLLQRLASRIGLNVTSDHSSIDSLSAMTMTVQPSESLLGAAYRATNQANAWLVPDNTPAFHLSLITPGTSTSGDYDDTAHTYPDDEWELIDAAELSNYNRLAFAYVLGTYSTDPDDGGYVAMAAGPALDNTRPMPYSVTNSRYNTTSRVDNAAAAEATRQKKLSIDAVIEAPANLSLELYDMISATDADLGWSAKQFRVRRIREQFDRGRLTHRIYCGEE